MTWMFFHILALCLRLWNIANLQTKLVTRYKVFTFRKTSCTFALFTFNYKHHVFLKKFRILVTILQSQWNYTTNQHCRSMITTTHARWHYNPHIVSTCTVCPQLPVHPTHKISETTACVSFSVSSMTLWRRDSKKSQTTCKENELLCFIIIQLSGMFLSFLPA